MWRKVAVLLVTIQLCISVSDGKAVKDPITDFITTEDFKYTDKDHISRVELDLNGDGKKVAFLSVTYIRHAGLAWTVYVPGKHGYVVGLPSRIENDMLCFTDDHSHVGYIREIKRRGIVFFQGRIADCFVFIAFWVSGGKAHLKEIGRVSGDDVENGTEKPDSLFKKYFPWRAGVEPPPAFKIESISVDDLRTRGYAISKGDRK